jgi:hypothetical protein
MPLSRAINYAHAAASNFLQNLIIPEKPISLLTVDVAEHVIEGLLDPAMLAVAVNVNARRKKTLQTKTTPDTRC